MSASCCWGEYRLHGRTDGMERYRQPAHFSLQESPQRGLQIQTEKRGDVNDIRAVAGQFVPVTGGRSGFRGFADAVLTHGLAQGH